MTGFLTRSAFRSKASIIQPLYNTVRRFQSSSCPYRSASSATSPMAPPVLRHFLSIADLSAGELSTLVQKAIKAKLAIKSGNMPASLNLPLTGKTVAMMFSKRSTRTRVSTEAAVVRLGGHPMFLGKEDIQLGVNESLYDTSKVISSMVSCIVARVGVHSEIADFARTSSVPVINALSDKYHPLQAVTDILTIFETFPRYEDLKVSWVGDANNVLYDFTIACAKVGISISIATPSTRLVDDGVLRIARKAAALSGATIEVMHEPEVAVRNADIIMTDTWVSMGQEGEKEQRIQEFKKFQVSSKLASRGGAKSDWRFMHCLPRKPDEVTDEVFYSNRSLVFSEAENRLFAAIASLEAFVIQKGNFNY